MTVTVYVDDGTGLTGHNVSGTMTVTILENLRPTFMGAVLVTPDLDLYQPGDTLMFTVVVRDTEGDIMNITIDWGDGESSTIENIVGEPDTNITRMINHTFDEGRSEAYRVNMTVDDGQMQYHSVKTWVSTYVSINVEKEDGGISTMVLVGIALVAIIVIALVVFLLMKRKKGEPKAEGGMEGMAPPEPPPPTN